MSEVFKIRKGLDIHLIGEAEKKVTEVVSDNFAIKPPDFTGVFPKMLLKEGDPVKAGTPVFFDKYRDNILFSSPVSGTIKEVYRGAKRKMLEVRIESDGKMEYEDFGTEDPNGLSRKSLLDKMLKSGVWPVMRQRPYSIIADPKDEPKAIFISAFDSSPLGPDMAFQLEGMEKPFQTGLDVLTKLTSGKVHLNLKEGESASIFTSAKGVQINYFSGPHPAGNISVQVNRIDPINKGDIIWYADPVSVAIIGKLFLEGKYDASKRIALTGGEVNKPHYYQIIAGCNIFPLVKDNRKSTDCRYISGNVLTGTQIEKEGYLGFYDNQITLIPEGNHHEFLGWAMPRLNKFSYSKTFFSWLTPKKKYNLDTNLNGGHRAFVLTGEYEKVFPLNIYPMQLLKAILVKDIDRMENLGIYEIDEEDFALCEFIDASKTEMQAIVREGLDFLRKEMS